MDDYVNNLEKEIHRLEAELDDWKSIFYKCDFEVDIQLQLLPWTKITIKVEAVPGGAVLRAWKMAANGAQDARFWRINEWCKPNILECNSFFSGKLHEHVPTTVVKNSGDIMNIIRDTKANPF